MLNLTSVTVGYINKPPFTQNDQKLDEVFFEIFLSIMSQFNLSYTLTRPLSGLWGQLDNQTRSWDGLMGDLVGGRVDVAVTSLAQTEQRETAVDFSIPVYVYRPVFTRSVYVYRPVFTRSVYVYRPVFTR